MVVFYRAGRGGWGEGLRGRQTAKGCGGQKKKSEVNEVNGGRKKSEKFVYEVKACFLSMVLYYRAPEYQRGIQYKILKTTHHITPHHTQKSWQAYQPRVIRQDWFAGVGVVHRPTHTSRK